MTVFALFVVFVALLLGRSYAVPGPDTTAVLANANVNSSVALAYYYAQQRGIPKKQVCLLNITGGDGVTTGTSIPLATYLSEVLYPTNSCLSAAGVVDRIEAFVLMRGIPLLVTFSSGYGYCSLAATLQLWLTPASVGSSELWIVQNAPNFNYNFIYTGGPFYPNYTSSYYQFRLVTMLNGRSYSDAMSLVNTAIAADNFGYSPSTLADAYFYLMSAPSPGDPRSVLDYEYPALCQSIRELGYNCMNISFNSNEHLPHKVASFMVGTASFGTTIENNTYSSCAVVDNLTSYGAVPINFTPGTGQSQVSISRWIEKGVLAAHGTVGEPYNDAFPDRSLLLDYLKESGTHQSPLASLSYSDLRKQVVGDAMAAPFARRPVITITAGYDSATNTFCGGSTCNVTVSATGPNGASSVSVGSIKIYANGDLVDQVQGNATTLSFSTGLLNPATYSGSIEILIVAQYADGPMSKGWVVYNNATLVSSLPSSSYASSAASLFSAFMLQQAFNAWNRHSLE